MGFIKASNRIMFVALILGFLLPQLGGFFSSYLIHILFVMMTISLISVEIHGTRGIRFKKIMYLLIINLVIFSSLLIFASSFIKNPDFRNGMIILALVPPAIAVVPLTKINRGDVDISIVTEFLAYLVCLVYTPVMLWFFLGGIVDIFSIMQILAALIILPFIASRIIRRVWKNYINIDTKPIITLLISISVYTAIALSRDIILADMRGVFLILLIHFALNIPLGGLIFYLTKKAGIERKERVEYVLFATLKNGNMAIGFSLLLIGPAAAVPISIGAISFGLYVPYLTYLFEKHDSGFSEKISNTAKRFVSRIS